MKRQIKNLLEGAATVLEIWPESMDHMDRKDFYPHKSEQDALTGDFEKIGKDFYKAIDHFEVQDGQE